MTNDPLTGVTTRRPTVDVPQTQPVDERQVENNAGGFTFQVNDMARLRRFLTLGVDGGTYYVKERGLALENAEFLVDLIETNGTAVVAEIINISMAGRAPRVKPAIFALALAASVGNAMTRRFAFQAVPQVVRTGTHLFTFVRYAEQFRGWGRGMKRAVASWYLNRSVESLTYQVLKYRNREGWTHRDVLRSAHPMPHVNDVDRRELFDWICGRGSERWGQDQAMAVDDQLQLLEGFLQAQRTTNPRVAARLVRAYKLSWEMLPDAVINSPQVWEELLTNGVPATALMRQLPRLTRLDMLGNTSQWTRLVTSQLTDVMRLTRARVHPINVLVALRTYASGYSQRGDSSWMPSRAIIDALDASFYASFGTIRSTGARLMLALDVSGSMATHRIANMPLTAREASAAMAMATARVESNYDIVGFTTVDGRVATWGNWRRNTNLSPLSIGPRQRLDDVIRTVSGLTFGGTDCALPMIHAARENTQVDTFVIYTDNETLHGDVHPHVALQRYRDQTGIAARLIVVGMTATEFTIADPNDHGQLDVVGFDAATPQLISDFASGGNA